MCVYYMHMHGIHFQGSSQFPALLEYTVVEVHTHSQVQEGASAQKLKMHALN